MAGQDPGRGRPTLRRRHVVVLADFAAGCLLQARLSLEQLVDTGTAVRYRLGRVAALRQLAGGARSERCVVEEPVQPSRQPGL